LPERLVEKLKNFHADARRWGLLRSLCGRVISWLQRFAGLNIHWILVRDLIGSRAEAQLPDGFALRVLEAEELLRATHEPELDIDSEFVHGALARGDMAFGAFDGDRLVCYSWRAFARAPHIDGVWVKISSPYHHGYKTFTRRSHRGQRIFAALMLFSDNDLVQRGRVAQVHYVDIYNFASLAAHEFSGSRRVGLAGYVKWFRFFIPFGTPAVKRIGFAFELGQ